MIPFFSIIIPTYNRASLLPRAIRSVEDQTFSDWELIIIDDGSTDNTSQVAKRISLRDSRIRYFFQQNKELNGARNAGVRLAKGKYVCFLDDDDEFLPNHLEVLFTADKAYDPNTVLRTLLEIVILDGKSVISKGYDNNAKHSLIQYWQHPSNLLPLAFPRRIFEDMTFNEDLLLMDDFAFMSSVLVKYKMVQLPVQTVRYHHHSAMRTRTYRDTSYLLHRLRAAEDCYVGEVADIVPATTFRKMQRHSCFHFARGYARHGKLKLFYWAWWKGQHYVNLFSLGNSMKNLIHGNLLLLQYVLNFAPKSSG